MDVVEDAVSVSIVMPCLNEIQSLPHCIENAKAALTMIKDQFGLDGEIVIADNGSTDGSQGLAVRLGARVALIDDRGYGAALIGGARAARGRYILMGDCDGSYDFTDGVAMIEALTKGHDVCMGSRFAGGIAPGAMPWKNRYVGNPVLTGILNLFFRTGIDDAHCGLRALTKEAFEELRLTGSGMEFASEMVIKARLRRLKMTQVPAKLLPDLRDRAPHLRPWRDGWRHLRYLFMLSPLWTFGVPAVGLSLFGAMILMIATGHPIVPPAATQLVGTSWTIFAGFAITAGHLALIGAMMAHIVGVRSGARRPLLLPRSILRFATFEAALVVGAALMALGISSAVATAFYWSVESYAPLDNVLPVVLSFALTTLGLQTIIGGMLASIVSGNNARFAGFGPTSHGQTG